MYKRKCIIYKVTCKHNSN